jgi:hypothetical protein
MLTVYKYEIKNAGINIISMPQNAQILTAKEQDNKPMMWAMVDTDNPMEERCFELTGTGGAILPMKEGKRDYIGTIMIDFGVYVFHLFEMKD